MVDWENLVISAGPVAPVAFTEVELDNHGVLHARFEKNPLHLRADGDDEVRVYAYCPAERRGVLSAPVYRRCKHLEMSLPDEWAGLEVHFYGFVTDYQQRASETIYMECVETQHAASLQEGQLGILVGGGENLSLEEVLDLVEGEGAVDGVVAHTFASQGAEEGAAAEGFA